MVLDDQSAVLNFLSNPAHYGVASEVERIDTHASSIFLVSDRAFKLKRAVRYDYLDYSTLERRHLACEAEVRLNRRTAPALYLGVIALTREADGTLAWNGPGVAVEWLVLMQRFPQDQLLDRMAATHLPVELMVPLADTIARFHAGAHTDHEHGGASALSDVIDGNAAAFADANSIDHALAMHITHASRRAVIRYTSLLDGRRAHGMVRQCHGDLHLRNIVLLDGRPVLFDAIEFNDDLACIDVLYDLAFLLMDLVARGLPAHANLLFNRYMARADDLDGFPLLPLFLSCRAAIRAKTSLAAAALQRDVQARQDLEARARTYLALADQLLHTHPPQLVAIGGPSGAGKSTLALRLAPGMGSAPGALIVRSDILRKTLYGVTPETRLPLPAYESVVNQRVYSQLRHEVANALQGGYCVIADAVFGEAAERFAIEDVANQLGIPFTGLWLEPDEAVLEQRLAARGPDASDATADVMHKQRRTRSGEISWDRIDASGEITETETRARRAIAARHPALALPSSGHPLPAGELTGAKARVRLATPTSA